MSNRSTDILFQLIHSLEKAEKRHFKLYIKRSSSNENLKVIQLFDAIDHMKDFDEKALLKKLPTVQKTQLSNLKAHLYKQIMASLRLLKSAESIDLQLNEQFDYAHILYKKGLFLQSLRILEKAKEMANTHQKFNILIQIISLEKRIEGLHITRSMQDRAESLSSEAIQVISQMDMVARLSNLALQLYSWYIRHGHARNEADEERVKKFFHELMPKDAVLQTGFYEQLYLYQSYSWYAFIRQDFILYYRYAQKWVNLFEANPLMKRVETGHYIKGLHNLLNAHFDLRNYPRLEETIDVLEAFAKTDRVQQHDNFRIQAWIYISQARMNQHFISGTFRKGLLLVPQIEAQMQANSLFVDRHRILVLNYKIAMLHFGSGDFETCIDYLQKIINDPVDLRHDLQCYARLLHLLAHYELKNYSLLEYLTKSVYRFMAKKEKPTLIEEEMFRFLRKSLSISHMVVRRELQSFLARIKQFEKDRFETRSFAYMDIISWVESKVYGKSMSEIISAKSTEWAGRRKKPAVNRELPLNLDLPPASRIPENNLQTSTAR